MISQVNAMQDKARQDITRLEKKKQIKEQVHLSNLRSKIWNQKFKIKSQKCKIIEKKKEKNIYELNK